MHRLCLTLSLLALAAGALPAPAGTPLSPSRGAEPKTLERDASRFHISQILESGDGKAELVVVDAGATHGLLNGDILTSYRVAASTKRAAAGASLWVETGRLKLVDVQAEQAMGEIIQDGTVRSARFFPRFPGVMASDVVVAQRVTIARRQINTPTTELRYDLLFEDPKRHPFTFELKKDGLAELRRAAAVFARARLSLLMVEGHTDQEGKAETNQVESYQRAMTVRQFLIDELGFDERRVVAVGYGEAEPLDRSMAPGQKQRNRRIVLKALAAGETKR